MEMEGPVTDDTADDGYLGPKNCSCLPQGLVSQIATSPGDLCTVCAALDLRQYFDNSETRLIPENTAESLIDRHAAFLGTVQEIFQRSDTCDFCQLVAWSLRKYDREIQDSQSRLPHDSSWLVSVVIRKSTIAHYRNIGNERQLVCGIEIGTDEVSGRPFEDQEKPAIRLLADDAHLLGLKPMYHGRLVGNHVSPSLIHSWIATCEHHHNVCENARYVVRRDRFFGARGLTFIDTKKMCLTKVRHNHNCCEALLCPTIVRHKDAMLFRFAVCHPQTAPTNSLGTEYRSMLSGLGNT